jgi:F0F1-type ATP synthase assembly protein I
MKDRDGVRSDEEAGHKEQSANRDGAAYQGALEAVFAILIAGGIGYWADGRFGTSPWLLILGFAIGFASFVLRLFQMGRRLNARASPANTKPGGRRGQA